MAEFPRFWSQVTRAFVDRAPIDWAAALSRVHAASDRAYLEDLRYLAFLRHAPTTTIVSDRSASALLARAVVTLAATQTVLSLVIIGVASLEGEPPIGRAPQVILACGFSAASLLLGAAGSRDPRTLFLLAWLVTAASAFARHGVAGLPAPSPHAIDVMVRGIPPEAFMPACLWEFALVFPRVVRFTAFDRTLRLVAGAAWLLGFALFGGNLLVALASTNREFWGPLVLGAPGSLFWRIILVAVAPAVGAILIRAKRAPLPERQRVGRLALAIAAGTTPILLLGIAAALVPAVNQWMLAASPAERLWLDVMVIGGLTMTPLLITFAVIVDRPFELHAVLSRPVMYATGRMMVAFLPMAAFTVFVVLLYQRRHASLAELFTSIESAPLRICFAVACTLVALRERLLNALDRRMFQRASDQRQRLARALERMRLARGMRETAMVLGRELRRGTGARTAAVLVRDQPGNFVHQTRSLAPLPSGSSLLAILRDTTGPLDVSEHSELRDLLPPSDTEWVMQGEAALIAPLKLRDDTIAAIAVLGPKPAGLPFNRGDQWLITALTTAVAATWTAEGDANSTERTERDQSTRGDREAAFECSRCGSVSDSPDLPCSCEAAPILAALPARLREKFLVVRRLGTGGMGVVYLAHDEELDRDVALKTLVQLAPGAVPRLQDEARAMAVLNHESLATIYGIEVWRRTPVLVVEYLAGGTLAHRLAGGPLSTAETIDLGARVARALASMHASGVLHRDLKPSNIGFTSAGAPKLLDFGLAVLTEPTSTGLAPMRHAAHAGTPAYLPPESFHGVPPGPAFDLWALAVVLLECVSGINPFADIDRASTIHRVATFKALALPVALRTAYPALSGFFERALDRNRERRFQTAPEFLNTLEALTAPDAIVRSSIDSRR